MALLSPSVRPLKSARRSRSASAKSHRPSCLELAARRYDTPDRLDIATDRMMDRALLELRTEARSSSGLHG
jgi:hypothetical protein